MFIHIHTTTETATAEGSIWRSCRCAYCRKDYIYHLLVRIRHREEELFDGSADQRERAEDKVWMKLGYLLRRKIEPIPCPLCYQFQFDMCELLRKGRYGWLTTLALSMLAVLASALILALTPNGGGPTHPVTLAFALLTAMIPDSTLGLQRWLWYRYDPNARASEEQRMKIAKRWAMTEAEFESRYRGEEAYDAE